MVKSSRPEQGSEEGRGKGPPPKPGAGAGHPSWAGGKDPPDCRRRRPPAAGDELSHRKGKEGWKQFILQPSRLLIIFQKEDKPWLTIARDRPGGAGVSMSHTFTSCFLPSSSSPP
ncbi:hypothetical protein kuro4_07610 [Gelria sp. Kuro-4]|nr:hypothetical protein kuro4_07610 [Gelria sp. Kuro-4]